jgi:catechol 2,3-dioxygenase-like lactoylglutathione lyase family enzyme
MRFDHLMHWVPDLDRAIAEYAALGFSIERGGQHPGGGTHNAIWRCPPAYLELIGVRDETEAIAAMGTYWPALNALLASGGGAGRFGVHVESVEADIVRLRNEGISVTDARPGSAKLDNGISVTWVSAGVVDGPPWAPFFIKYGTSMPERTDHVRATKIPRWVVDRLVVETRDPQVSAEWLARVLGTTRQPGTATVVLEGANVEFRQGESGRVTNVLLRGNNPPSGAIAGLRVDHG